MKLISIEYALKQIKIPGVFIASIPSDPPPSPPYRALAGLDKEGSLEIKSSILKI